MTFKCIHTSSLDSQLHFAPFGALVRQLWTKCISSPNVGQYKKNAVNVICNNRTNGIIHLGHTTGTVTLWSPNSDKFVAKMLCHRVSVLYHCKLGSATTTHFYGRVGSLYTRPDPTNGRVGRVFGRVFWSFLVASLDRVFENKEIITLFLFTSTVFWRELCLF